MKPKRLRRAAFLLDWDCVGDLGMRFCEAYELVYHRGSGKTVEVIRAQADIQAADSLNRIADNQVALRDHFAALALSTASAYPAEDVATWSADDFAMHAYNIADAMLKYRNK